MPDNIVKAIQQMKCLTLSYPNKPDKTECMDAAGQFDKDEYEMAKFAWRKDYKAMRARKDKYNENKLMSHMGPSHIDPRTQNLTRKQ